MVMIPGTSFRGCGLVRAGDGEKHPAIVGYGAVFFRADDAGTEYQLWEDTFERIMPGAFDRALREDDVRSMFNHDPNMILGRTSANTLLLSVDRIGLKYEVEPDPLSPVCQHVLASVRRGDVSGSSFMFIPTRTKWLEVMEGERRVWYREIEEVDLWEVGPVVFPAYAATTAGVRSVTESEGRSPSDAPSPSAPQWRSWYDAHVRSARASFENWRRGVSEEHDIDRVARERRQRRAAVLGLSARL